jgi:hypothetical protein
MEPEQASMGPVTEDRRGQAARLRDARSHLRQADPVLARLIDERPDFDPRGWMAELPALGREDVVLPATWPCARRSSPRITSIICRSPPR